MGILLGLFYDSLKAELLYLLVGLLFFTAGGLLARKTS